MYNSEFLLIVSRYILIGMLSAIIELVIFFQCKDLHPIILYNTLAYLSGVFFSFSLNLFFNFKVNNSIFKRLTKFLFVNIIGLFLSNLVILFLKDKFILIYIKVISMPIIVLIQFLVNYFWTFQKQSLNK